MKHWNIYLSGEIKSTWREEIADGVAREGLPVVLTSPVTEHSLRDKIGEEILGNEDAPFWRDHKGAKINSIRNRTLIRQADIVVVCFGEEYRQWNWAFDAGFAAALDKPLLVIHEPELTHSLKELDAAAQAVAESPEQIVQILRYVITAA